MPQLIAYLSPDNIMLSLAIRYVTEHPPASSSCKEIALILITLPAALDVHSGHVFARTQGESVFVPPYTPTNPLAALAR